jgi:hypothetical protein
MFPFKIRHFSKSSGIFLPLSLLSRDNFSSKRPEETVIAILMLHISWELALKALTTEMPPKECPSELY